jgi:CubicO group peptidase (beta-lactamase class C family)
MSAPLSVVRIAPLTERRLLARLAAVQVEGRLPSVVAALLRDGRLVWSAGYGDVPGDPLDVQYRIGSITKTFTAVLVMQLVEDGLASLEDQASRWLGPDVPFADRTLRELLVHDGGLPAEPVGEWWERRDGGTFADLATANAGAGPVFGRGERFHYSNLGYGLLGEVVARVREQSWWEAVGSRVLEPLGMSRTTYEPSKPHALGFSVHPYAGTLTAEPLTDTGAMAPAGQLWSTLSDLTGYTRFLLDGHRDVLSRDVLARMATPRAGTPGAGLTQAHGLGFQLWPGGSGTLMGHTGSMPGFVAGCFVDPARRTGAVMLCNGTTGVRTAPALAGMLEELETWEPSVPAPWRPTVAVPPAYAELLGLWHWGNTPHVFAVEGSDLVVRVQGVEQYRYRVDGDRIVGISGYQAGEELCVVRSDSGEVDRLELATFRLTREPYGS